jgi:hypothetical protein
MNLTALPTSDLLLMKRSMPRTFLKLVVILLALMTVFSTGCKKKRPKLPAVGQVPTIVVQAPDGEIPEIEEPEEPITIDLPEPAPRRRPRRPVAKKPTPPVQEPPKTIVNGGIPAPDVQISTAGTQALNRQRESTNQLLDVTESRLKGLNRQLSDSEQSMAQQIRAFISQSRTANEEGDIERAQVLANKAHLLCEELVKR